MDGVILFADDNVFESGSTENKLFQKFNSDDNFSVLPINNLNTLEKTVTSISTYKALILDWNFKKVIDDEDDEIEVVKIPDENPLEFLKTNKIYSLVYVYSQNHIEEDIKSELKELYPKKIFFNKKENDTDISEEYNKIRNDIKDFGDNNKHLTIPFLWSQTINQSAQKIFRELEQADPNWIKEIYDTALKDGAEPNLEVINIFQNLLSETIIEDTNLLNSINSIIKLPEAKVSNKEEATAKLFHRIYYTKLESSAPFMTGDIFKFSSHEFAILITPECDVNSKKDTALEFLLFKKEDYEDFLKNKRGYEKTEYEDIKLKGYKKDSNGNQTKELKGKLKELVSDFNNGNIKYHILPSFPFENNEYNLSAFINFETAYIIKNKSEFKDKRTEYKLNSPYIFQLRQRYLAYAGRVGVPAIPQSIRLFNLK